MKKILVSILFISSGQMHTAQFARKLGKFLCAPSIGIGIVSARAVYKKMHDDLGNYFNQPLHTDDLDPDFVKTVEREAAKRGLKNVGITYAHRDYGIPNMFSTGNANKSVVEVNCGCGVSRQERDRLLALEEKISFYTKLVQNGINLEEDNPLYSVLRQYEQNLITAQNDLNDIVSSRSSLNETLFLIGHELSHVQANDTRSTVAVDVTRVMLPFVSWRAARLSGRGRLISLGAAGLSFLTGIFANILFRKSIEYKADYNASNDPQILKAGAQMMDKNAKSTQLIKESLVEKIEKIRSGSKLSEEEKIKMQQDIIDLFARTIQHPDPAKRAERLRARAQELREQNK